VCLFDPDWHPGVVGLVASKMKERLHRTVIAFAPADADSPQLRGSARSIPGLNVRDVLAAVPRAHLEAFTHAFEQAVAVLVSPELLDAVILTDGALHADEFSAHNARALRDGGPWGQGFPEPVFDGVFEVLDSRVLKGQHLKLRLRPLDGGPLLNAIHFGGAASPLDTHERMVYRLQTDDYRGGEAVQLIVEHRQPFTPSSQRSHQS